MKYVSVPFIATATAALVFLAMFILVVVESGAYGALVMLGSLGLGFSVWWLILGRHLIKTKD